LSCTEDTTGTIQNPELDYIFLSHLVTVSDGLPVDELLGAMPTEVRYHHLVHAVDPAVHPPLAALVQVRHDWPDLETKYHCVKM